MKTRVLVVDDDRMVADTLSLIYNQNGYECEARYSAMEGYARAQHFCPAMMLCDITMPEENGLQLAGRVQKAMPAIRILMLTACANSAGSAASMASCLASPIKILRKPCRPEDLLRESALLLQAI